MSAILWKYFFNNNTFKENAFDGFHLKFSAIQFPGNNDEVSALQLSETL